MPPAPPPPQARKLSESEQGGDSATIGEQAIRKELESLAAGLGSALGARGVDPEDLK